MPSRIAKSPAPTLSSPSRSAGQSAGGSGQDWDIRIASVWYRPTDRTIRAPDYFVHETADWLILPYELSGLSIPELREQRPELASIIDRLEAYKNREADKCRQL